MILDYSLVTGICDSRNGPRTSFELPYTKQNILKLFQLFLLEINQIILAVPHPKFEILLKYPYHNLYILNYNINYEVIISEAV